MNNDLIDEAIETLNHQGMVTAAAAVGDMRAELQSMKESSWAKNLVDKLTERIAVARKK
jgi:hypothetical protein